MDLIPGGQHSALAGGVVGQFRLPLLGHQRHHPHDLLQNRQHIHPRRRVQHAAVQPGQAQQVLGDAAEPLRLLADVRHEFPGGGGVDILRLQNGVRQQPNGRQRRFQFVGRVGHEAPPGIFRFLQPVRQAVELLADLGDLVPPWDLRPVAVGPLPHLADGGEQPPDLAGQCPGQHHAQRQHHHGDHSRQPQQVFLKALEQRRLLRVVFVGVHGADDLVLIQHRRRRPAAEGAPLIAARKGVMAQQRLDSLRVKGILPHGTAGLPGIVEDFAGAVSHQDAGNARFLHHRHGRGDILLSQPLQPRQGIHHDGHAGLEGAGLGAEHQVLRDQQGIGVQQQQHRRDDQDIAEAEF